MDTMDRLSPPWSETHIAAAIALVRARFGSDISCYEKTFLQHSLEKRRQATAAPTTLAYLDLLANNNREAATLSSSLRIIYSEFFRDTLGFAHLEQLILPDLLHVKEQTAGTEIRVWSAGCAAGQEAWSIAILLDELTGTENTTVSYRIFASDLSAPDISVAQTAVYSAENLGNIRLRHINRCFSRQGDSCTVASRLRAKVDFSLHDLLDASTTCPPTSIFGDFDLILCCNLLLYYRPEAQRFMLNKMQRCLAPGGYLMVGETERRIVESAGDFRPASQPATVFYTAKATR